MSWPTEQLGNVMASIKSGFASGEKDQDGTIQFRMNNAKPDGSVTWSEIRRVPADQKKIQKYRVRKGDVLFNQTNSRELVGKTVLFQGHEEEVLFSNHFLRLRPRESSYDGAFLARYLQHVFRLGYFSDKCTAWVNQATFGKEKLERLEVPVPPLEDQKRIATILDKADGIRQKRQRLLEVADRFLVSAYLYTIGHLNPSHGDWEPCTVEALAEDRKGAIRSGPFGSALRHGEFVDQGIAVLGIDNAVQNRFAWAERRFITPSKYEELRRYKVFPGDVIITIMGTTGRSAVVPDDIPEAITTKHLATITCNKELIHPEVLSFAIHSDPLIIRQIKSFNKGAIMDGLNLGIIRKLEINLPPMEVQLQFVRMLRKARAIETRSQTSEGSGEDLFQSLSQRAFRGEL